jgi:hypothetical protein
MMKKELQRKLIKKELGKKREVAKKSENQKIIKVS